MIFLISVYALFALLEFPDLIRKKHWRDLAVFSALYAATFVLAFLYVKGVKIPSPMRLMHKLIVEKWRIPY